MDIDRHPDTEAGGTERWTTREIDEGAGVELAPRPHAVMSGGGGGGGRKGDSLEDVVVAGVLHPLHMHRLANDGLALVMEWLEGRRRREPKMGWRTGE